MTWSSEQKEQLKSELVACLSPAREIRRIVIFGSFAQGGDAEDIDVAVFQDSHEGYLHLAMKYRRLTRAVSHRIPLDIIPLKTSGMPMAFLAEVEKGEVIFER